MQSLTQLESLIVVTIASNLSIIMEVFIITKEPMIQMIFLVIYAKKYSPAKTE